MQQFKIIDILLILISSYFIVYLIKVWIDNYNNLKKIKKELAKLEANKCKGFHNWIEIEIMGEKSNVCRDCCWSPKYDTFVKKFFVDSEIQRIDFNEGLERYKKNKIEELAAKYFMEVDDLHIVAEEILKIKKDFTIQHLEKKLEDMKQHKKEE